MQVQKVKERTGEYFQRTETDIQKMANDPKIQLQQKEIHKVEGTRRNYSKHWVKFWEKQGVILPESTDDTYLANQMSNFFMNKIHKVSMHGNMMTNSNQWRGIWTTPWKVLGNWQLKE